jgi:hypothetical protein
VRYGILSSGQYKIPVEEARQSRLILRLIFGNQQLRYRLETAKSALFQKVNVIAAITTFWSNAMYTTYKKKKSGGVFGSALVT